MLAERLVAYQGVIRARAEKQAADAAEGKLPEFDDDDDEEVEEVEVDEFLASIPMSAL